MSYQKQQGDRKSIKDENTLGYYSYLLRMDKTLLTNTQQNRPLDELELNECY